MPPHLKKTINQAHLENGTYEKTMLHLQRELELNRLEAPDELKVNTVTKQVTKPNPEKPKPTCHHCKKPDQLRNQCRQLRREKDQSRNHTTSRIRRTTGQSQNQQQDSQSNTNECVKSRLRPILQTENATSSLRNRI